MNIMYCTNINISAQDLNKMTSGSRLSSARSIRKMTNGTDYKIPAKLSDKGKNHFDPEVLYSPLFFFSLKIHNSSLADFHFVFLSFHLINLAHLIFSCIYFKINGTFFSQIPLSLVGFRPHSETKFSLGTIQLLLGHT